MLVKFFQLLFVILIWQVDIQAQERTDSLRTRKGLDPSRIFFGGNFGLTFGNFTFINVSPQVGYRVTPTFSAGGGVNFIYQSDKYTTGGSEVKSNLGYAGLNIFGRANIARYLILNVQPELNYVWGKTTINPGRVESNIDSKIVPTLLIGGGAMIPTGNRGGLMIMLQYDVIQDPLSPYGNRPFVSFGFNF